MAKHYILDNTGTRQLIRLADSDEKKNNFLQGQNIYVAVQATDNDYTAVKNGTKRVSLSGSDAALIEDFSTGGPEFFVTDDGIDIAKEKIKETIEFEIRELEAVSHPNTVQITNALRQIDVDSLTAVPTGTVTEWIFSQSGAPSQRWFEL